jgi:dolichyl-phosphate-mannose--protein O-mannosyl transferase
MNLLILVPVTSDAPTLQPPLAEALEGVRLRERVVARLMAILPPLLITGAAGFLRFWRLGTPHSIIPLDETYYAPNSFGYLCHGTDMTFAASAPHTCAGLEPAFAVHPPVGKLLTAIGIKIFGYRPFGWRFIPAVVGTLIVLLIYLIARRLWPEKRWPAVAAAILATCDGLLFVQSRIAMLDIYVAFFVILGVWLLLEDRARAVTWTGPRWWRIGSGFAFGLAIATKWAAIPMVPVVAAVALAWEAVRIRDVRPRVWVASPDAAHGEVEPSPDPGGFLRRTFVTQRSTSMTFQVIALVGTFVLLPIAVYLASYTPWMMSSERYVPPRCTGKASASYWLCYQKEIYEYHRNLKPVDLKGEPIHPYQSQPWSWPWISRPASHYNARYCENTHTPEPCAAGQNVIDEEIVGLPNPIIWWSGFFIALPACLFWMIWRRDETAALIVVLFAPLVVPWFVFSRPLFLFYMTPATVFLSLMVVHAMVRWRWRWLAAAYVLLAAGAFAYFYPVLTAYPLPLHGTFGWESRMWFGHGIRGDCLTAKIKLLCWI